jgi:K+-transporting ATPase KdpF subunit
VILALAMSGDDLLGLIIAVAVTAYLIYALIFPEKL